MKHLFLSLTLAVAGCRTAPTAPLPPSPPSAIAGVTSTPTVVPQPLVSPPLVLEQKVRQQSQIIEALVSQNDALVAKLAIKPAMPEPSQVPPPTVPVPIASAPVPAPIVPTPAVSSKTPNAEPLLTPNAEGIIDLSARAPVDPDAPVNPFAVRVVPSESLREITLHVGGIIAGSVACAVINDRLVQAGETIESFAVDQIDANGVLLRRDGRRLRLPVASRPYRVRFAL